MLVVETLEFENFVFQLAEKQSLTTSDISSIDITIRGTRNGVYTGFKVQFYDHDGWVIAETDTIESAPYGFSARRQIKAALKKVVKLTKQPTK